MTSKTWLAVGAGVIALAATTPALAQVRSFNIPAQTLSSAITIFGRQAGVQIVAPDHITRAKRSNPVQGQMEVRAALSRLIAGSGLAVASDQGGTIILRGAASQHEAQSQARSPRQEKRAVAGRVFDEDGTALPGASVTVLETGQKTTTNLQGEFDLKLDGNKDLVTIEVNYLGYPVMTKTVSPHDTTDRIEFVVTSNSASADIVVLGLIGENTARSINQQRQADNTINVLSADVIGRFPDPNIAEALQRVPGIGIERDMGEGRYVNVRGAPAEFSAVTIDGVRVSSVDPTTRAVDLDTIPSDVVANLEVAKSLLPSQEADSIAGAINIVTRSNFDARGLRIGGSGGVSHNQRGGNDRRAAASISAPIGSAKELGISLAGSYSLTDRRPENLENVWVRDGVYGISETLLKDYETKRQRIAGTASVEWHPSAASQLFLRGSFSQLTDKEYRDQLSILWSEGTRLPGATDQTATFRNTRLDRQYRYRVQRNRIFTITGGGEHRFDFGRLEFNASYNRSEQTYPRREELLYRSSLRPTLSYDTAANPDQPTYSLFSSREHLQTGGLPPPSGPIGLLVH